VQQSRVDLQVSKKFGKFASPVVLDVAHGFSSYAHQGRVLQVTSASFKARRVNPKNFFAELKRRNVYKVAIAYGVVAWLLMQVASQIFPFFEIPNWAVRLVVLLLIIGFPIALILAWAFELTPEGIKRTEVADAAPTEPSAHRAWIYVVVIAGAISVGVFFLGRYTSSKQSRGAELPAKSVAVLPFINLSRDPDNAYFAAGIQDEIITRLAKITELKVISCTSTQRFKSAPDDLPAIAKELGVANIMEGSVQRSADQVRVNVQLIKAENDAHLWADTFDRKLTDIFKIESEIAKTVAETLRAKLTGSEQHAIAARPTENTEAYQLYLKGRFFWNKRTGENLKKAANYFNEAIGADPKYALAYVGLADAYVLMPFYSGGAPQDCYPKAKAAAKKALELDDTLAEAHTSLAYVLQTYDLDFDGSTREFQRAIELNPNYATAHHWYDIELLVPLGRFDEAIREAKRGLELDPLSLPINGALGRTYYFTRRYDEAIEQLRKTAEMDPGFYYAHWNLGSALAAKGAIDAAIEEYQKARTLNDDPFVLGLLARAYGFSGNKAEAMKILDELAALSKQRYVSAYSFALVYLGLGDKEETLRWLEKSYQDRAGNDLAYIRVEPLLDPLRGDPRFEALVAKVFAPKKADADLRQSLP
jgi:TolB-like protein/tetratricopeptide (TPR) repeat protein